MAIKVLSDAEAAAEMKARGIPKSEIEAAIPKKRHRVASAPSAATAGKPKTARKPKATKVSAASLTKLLSVERELAAIDEKIKKLEAQRVKLQADAKTAGEGLKSLLARFGI